MVEDQGDLLHVTSDWLRQLGYHVHCAANGAEAMQALNDGNRFDLLFSDVTMPPGINGVELARKVQSLIGDMRILLTSGEAVDILAQHGAEGQFPIIWKPYRRAVLAQCLRRLMSGE